MTTRSSISIDRFLPVQLTRNKAQFQLGRLMRNENYLYMINGGLEERNGGSDLAAGPAAAKAYGFANYINDEGSQFLLLVQGTKIYYHSSGWNDTGITITANQKTRFEHAGFGSNRDIYAVNGQDDVIKITTTASVPAASYVASSPSDASYLRQHKNRLFAANNRDTLYFTDVNAFETWQLGTNDIRIAPGVDGYIMGLEIWGDSLFIFKERGIYVIPNAAETSSNWAVLKVDAETGTQSPDTIRRTKDGVYFLSTDGKVRRINPNVTFTSGEYVLGGTGSPSVSEMVQEEIDLFIERSNIENAHAILHKDLYILSYNTTAASGNENDRVLVADTTKKERIPNIEAPQPFWTTFTNFKYDFFATQTLGNDPILYCVDEDATTVSRLERGVHNDSGSAIESVVEVGWSAPPDRFGNANSTIYRRFHPIIVYADIENWSLDVRVQAYRIEGYIPEEISGREYEVAPTSTTSNVGTAIVGTDVVSNAGIKSQIFRPGLRGNYFAARLENLNADEFTRVNRIDIYYENIHTL